MTGAEFFAALKKLEAALKQIGLGRPKTVAELNQALADLQRDAVDEASFDKLQSAEQDVFAVRLARLQQGLESFADGSTDPSSIMYKKLASNFAIWSQALLVGAVTLALIFSICQFWEQATKGATLCGPQASVSANTAAKPHESAPEKSPAPAGGTTTSPEGAAAKTPEGAAVKTPEGATTKTQEVEPSQVTLTTCEAVQLKVADVAASDVKWPEPEDVPIGSLSKDGVYTAPASIAAQQQLRISATVKTGSQSQKAKAANIVLMPPGGPREKYVLIMIALMGALGGCLHWISGFVLFVGNREFLRSWIPYYVLMPIEGAALAIIVYMLLRVGILTPTSSSGQNTAALNTIGLYAFAGLTGIYSKQALTSLGDVFNTIFKKVQAKDQSKTDPKADTKATS